MKNLRIGAIVVAAVVLSGLQPLCAQTSGITWHSDISAARKEAERLNRPILVHFGAEWCGPCQQMERQVLNQPKVKERLQGSIVGLKIDIDHDKYNLAKKWNIASVPTDIIVEPNAARLVESEGFRSIEQYVEMIDRASARYANLLATRQPKATPPVANTPAEFGSDPAQFTNTGKAELMLDGYCPVTLNRDRRWVKGEAQIRSEYKGQLYWFVNSAAKDDFQKSPEKFVPQFLGCDPVIAWNSDRAVPGSIEFGAFYDDRLYLFTSDENRKKFKGEPDKFLTTRVVLYVDQIESVLR